MFKLPPLSDRFFWKHVAVYYGLMIAGVFMLTAISPHIIITNHPFYLFYFLILFRLLLDFVIWPLVGYFLLYPKDLRASMVRENYTHPFRRSTNFENYYKSVQFPAAIAFSAFFISLILLVVILHYPFNY